jgi:hypothetical protein
VADDWERYGRALIGSMAEVLREADDEIHPLMLETADYWLALGLAMGLEHPDQASALLALIESNDDGRRALAADARAFIEEVTR